MSPKKKYCYSAYGLTIESDICFPELVESKGKPDVFIRIKRNLVHKPDDIYLTFAIEKLGWFRISNREILVVPYIRKTSVLRPFILGTAFGALMLQRNMAVIHGSAVRLGRKACIFCGTSGEGKSTLAAAFASKGYTILSDDVCVISLKKNKLLVHPSYPQLKLWPDSTEKTGFNAFRKKRISGIKNKFAFSITHTFYSRPLSLNALFILNRKRKNLKITELKGAEKFNALASQAYRPALIKKLHLEKHYFHQISYLSEKIKVYHLNYPTDFNKIEKIIRLIHFYVKKNN